jgi:tRNA(Ile)-lysidine synthase TilS/MesJ
MEVNMNSELSYHHWKKEHESILGSLPGKDVFLLFSGGKDSSLTLYLISRAADEFGFDFEAHAGAYPVHRYTDAEKKRIESYWNKRGVDIIWHDVGETDDYIENTANPCLPCQRVRKKKLNSILTNSTRDWGALCMIPSFSLWDIASYSLEYLLGDIYSSPDQEVNGQKSKRFIEIAQRFYPLLKMKEGYMVFRPILKYNNGDILKMIEQEQIPVLSIPCRFRGFRPKRVLQQYYEKMGLVFDYDQVLGFAKKSLDLPDISSYASIEKEEYLLNVF